ncbi:MAG TPA: site-specific DNA-methyltransferase [Armatimonadota bacterium]|jgi:DNA modification methylase
MKNTLYYGDNLPIMREYIADETVDLVYLDPPFNSSRDYNVLFKQARDDENQAQITAFTDTWQWSKSRYEDFFDDPKNAQLYDLMESLSRILGTSEMMAYLLMMAPRLLELRRVLKPMGSLYLHCDPVASHYLKIMLDVVFGAVLFQSEIIWKRSSQHGGAVSFNDVHDVILYYSSSREFIWNPQYISYSGDYVKSHYCSVDKDGRRYQLVSCTGAGCGPSRRFGETELKPPLGRHWAWTQEKIDALMDEGRIILTKRGMPRLKRYLDESPGVPLGTVWTDIQPVNSQAQERIGYPTQKPITLLERIINASSNPGDIILDPFCGCGTAVAAAEKLGRRWIGIDITYLAIDVMANRLEQDFGIKSIEDYEVVGVPKDANSARELFIYKPKQFEIWAVSIVGGFPQPEKTGDKGVDGKVYFIDESRKTRHAICQVKGGKLVPSMIRDFEACIGREKASMGFFISLETPTKGMYQEAEELGFFESPSGRKIPKLQIRTIKELLDRKDFDFPKGYALRSSQNSRMLRHGEQGEIDFAA